MKPKRKSLKELRLIQRVDALISAGNKASNICYNFAQKMETSVDKSILQDTYKEWDCAKHELRNIFP